MTHEKEDLKPVSLHFGALAEPIQTQLGYDGLAIPTKADILHIQKDADAITRLFLRGHLSEAEKHRAQKRLMKFIAGRVIEVKPRTAKPNRCPECGSTEHVASQCDMMG